MDPYQLALQEPADLDLHCFLKGGIEFWREKIPDMYCVFLVGLLEETQ